MWSSVNKMQEASDRRLGCNDNSLALDSSDSMSPVWLNSLAAITACMFLISVSSNLAILYWFVRHASLRRSSSNILALNLSLSDLVYCIQWPVTIYTCVSRSRVLLDDASVCNMLGFLTLSSALTSILTVSVLSLERAYVIASSSRNKNCISNRCAWIIVGCMWLLSISSTLPPLMGVGNRYTLDPSHTSCTLDYLTNRDDYKPYVAFLWIVFWILPAVTIVVSYALIIKVFHKSSANLKRITASSEGLSMRDSVSRMNTCTTQLSSNVECSKATTLSRAMSSRAFSNARSRLRDSLKIKSLNRRRASQDRRRASRVSAASCSAVCSGSTHNMTGAGVSMIVTQATDGRSTPSSVSVATESQRQSARKSHPQAGSQRQRPLSRTSHGSRSMGAALRHTRDSFRSSLAGRACRRVVGLRASDERAQPLPLPPPPPSQQYTLAQSKGARRMSRKTLMRRLAAMSAYLIIAWLISWAPIATLAMMNSVSKCGRASAAGVFIACVMTKIGPTFDVFIYGLSHPKLKSGFVSSLARKWRQSRAQTH